MADRREDAPITNDTQPDECLRTNWGAIRTKVRRGALLDMVNIRLLKDNGTILSLEERMDTISGVMQHMWSGLTCVVKLNCSYGSVLTHKTTEEHRYHHASSNNAGVFDTPSIVRSQQDLEEFCDRISLVDIKQMATSRRPNTSWKLRLLTNVSFYVYKMPGLKKIGAGKKRARRVTPAYLLNSSALRGVGQNYDDNLCFFRCLAVRRSCTCLGDNCRGVKRFDKYERETLSLYKKFLSEFGLKMDVEGFIGVDYDDLLIAEKMFDIRITVYSMQLDKSTTIVWQSACKAKDKLRLNLNVYGNHYSLITRMDRYPQLSSANTLKPYSLAIQT